MDAGDAQPRTRRARARGRRACAWSQRAQPSRAGDCAGGCAGGCAGDAQGDAQDEPAAPTPRPPRPPRPTSRARPRVARVDPGPSRDLPATLGGGARDTCVDILGEQLRKEVEYRELVVQGVFLWHSAGGIR